MVAYLLYLSLRFFLSFNLFRLLPLRRTQKLSSNAPKTSSVRVPERKVHNEPYQPTDSTSVD